MDQLPEGLVYHQSRSPDAPDRVNRTPVMIDDPAEIQRTREMYAKGAEQGYENALNQVREGGWIFLDTIQALKQFPDKMNRDLSAVMNDPMQSAAARAKAAEVLTKLHHESGERFLFDCLQSSDDSMRLATLKSLGEYGLDCDFSRDNRAALVHALLKDGSPDVAKQAAHLCRYRHVPGSEAAMLELWQSGKASDPTSLAEHLLSIATTPETVQAVLPHLAKNLPDKFESHIGYILGDLIENPNPDISGPCRKVLYEYTLRFPDQRYDQTLVRDLARAANVDAIDVLVDIQTQAKDPTSRIYATQALARLQPEQGINILLTIVEEGGRMDWVADDLQNYARPEDLERISTLLLKSKDPWEQPVVSLCFEKLGPAGQAWLNQHQDRLSASAKACFGWKTKAIDIRNVIQEAHGLGIVSKTSEELIQALQKPAFNETKPRSPNWNDPGELMTVFAADDILHGFDVETGEIPCRHDQFLQDLAYISRGKLAAECPVQFWLAQSEEDYNAPYYVQFIADDKVFRVGAENYGDWYDVEAIVDLANFSLEKTGHPERFIPLENQGQFAVLVFADPAKLLPFAKKYQIPLSDDIRRAMDEGLEFEKRVLDSLKQQ